MADFTDPRWGPDVSTEEIWSYKSQALAQQAFLCELLAQDLANTVHLVNRPAWKNQIDDALPQFQAAQAAAKNMCNVVTASKPK